MPASEKHGNQFKAFWSPQFDLLLNTREATVHNFFDSPQIGLQPRFHVVEALVDPDAQIGKTAAIDENANQNCERIDGDDQRRNANSEVKLDVSHGSLIINLARAH